MIQYYPLLFLTIFLAGCDLFAPPKQITDKEVLCRQLKSQMIYNSFNNNNEASYLTDTQNNKLEDQYKKNCKNK